MRFECPSSGQQRRHRSRTYQVAILDVSTLPLIHHARLFQEECVYQRHFFQHFEPA